MGEFSFEGFLTQVVPYITGEENLKTIGRLMEKGCDIPLQWCYVLEGLTRGKKAL